MTQVNIIKSNASRKYQKTKIHWVKQKHAHSIYADAPTGRCHQRPDVEGGGYPMANGCKIVMPPRQMYTTATMTIASPVGNWLTSS